MADEFAVDHGFVSYKFYWIQYTLLIFHYGNVNSLCVHLFNLLNLQTIWLVFKF